MCIFELENKKKKSKMTLKAKIMNHVLMDGCFC